MLNGLRYGLDSIFGSLMLHHQVCVWHIDHNSSNYFKQIIYTIETVALLIHLLFSLKLTKSVKVHIIFSPFLLSQYILNEIELKCLIEDQKRVLMATVYGGLCVLEQPGAYVVMIANRVKWHNTSHFVIPYRPIQDSWLWVQLNNA